MARSVNQRLKLLYLMDILTRETDAKRGLTIDQLIDKLDEWYISVERKTIYSDVKLLNEYGFKVEKQKKKGVVTYHHTNRLFQLSELQMLIDNLQSSKFISQELTDTLAKKIVTLCSEREAKTLYQNPTAPKWVKSSNDTVLENVEIIQRAIMRDKQISFRYFNYDRDKKPNFHNEGAPYIESPWDLLYTRDNYYVMVYNEIPEPKHYRLDKMTDLVIMDVPRIGNEHMKRLDKSTYAQNMFGMITGETVTVNMIFHNSLADAVIERFGHSTTLEAVDRQHFRIRVPIVVSEPFFGWIFGFGDKAKITAPKSVVDRMMNYLREISALYHLNVGADD